MCCFCGGDTPAVTEDHVPNRAFFDGRRWPEGYCFPACEPCNSITRCSEKVVAFLARINAGTDTLSDLQRDEARKLITDVNRAFPDAFRSMRLRGNEVRHFLKSRGISRPEGVPLSDIPLVSVCHPVFTGAIKLFCTKLLCALHYKHTGQIAPAGATIAATWYSNLDDRPAPVDALRAMTGRGELKRSGNDLQDQFSYLYTVAAERTVTAYFCTFRATFAVLGYVSCDPAHPGTLDEDLEEGRIKTTPFQHRKLL